MNSAARVVSFVLIGISAWHASQAAPTCKLQTQITRADANAIVADASRTTRTLDGSFFGFNLEWLEFQSGIWDTAAQRPHPDAVRILKAFPGAVYRFPGGNNANNIQWQDSIGPLGSRPLRKHVSWQPPLKAEFGPDEYLKFVQEVGGQAWYVVNLAGAPDAPVPLNELTADARQLAAHMTTQANAGLPRVLRWELGNELDRGRYLWSPAQLTNAAQQVAVAIKQSDGGATFVHLQQEYPAQASKGYTAQRYNRELRAGLTALKPEFAMHFYYDGVPDTPPVSYFLSQLCQVVESAKAEGSPTNVWITEHARVPNGFWSGTPKTLWPETANLTAAISIADMLIAAAQIPEVSGAFTHSLVASSSPWPLFHKRPNGSLDASATLMGMMVLRQSMKPLVLATTQIGLGGGWQGASYALRTAVLASADHLSFTLWSINRSNQRQKLQFQLKNAPTGLALTNALRISDPRSAVSNHAAQGQVQLDSTLPMAVPMTTGGWTIDLPPNSVNAMEFR